METVSAAGVGHLVGINLDKIKKLKYDYNQVWMEPWRYLNNGKF